MARMHQLDTLQHLIGHHQDRLQTEASSTLVELIFQRRSQQVHDHQVVGILRAEIVHLGKAGRVLQLSVHLVLVAELRTAGAVLFKLDGHLFAVGADAQVNVAEGTAADALGDAVFLIEEPEATSGTRKC